MADVKIGRKIYKGVNGIKLNTSDGGETTYSPSDNVYKNTVMASLIESRGIVMDNVTSMTITAQLVE